MNATTFHMLFQGFNTNVEFVPCSHWVGPQHIFVQIANFLIFLGLFVGSSGIYTLIFLRIMLLLANLVTLLWAWLVTCSVDQLLWHGIFALLNFVHMIVLFFKLHPFIRFPHEVELAYRNLFKPLGVSRYDFKRLYSCTRGIHSIKPKDVYALEKKTLVDKLSLLLSGRVSVVRKGVTCHIIDCYQFIESPEWFGMSSSETYQVSIVALEESQLLVWNRDKLKLTISSDRYLQTILDHILGKDIVKKLMLSLDIETTHVPSEKTKLIQPNFGIDQIVSLNTVRNPSQCFWNLKSNTFETETHETTL